MQLVEAWRTAVSRGPGYERLPTGGHIERDAVRGYPVDYSAKTGASTAETPEALLPAGLIQLALGWWEHHLAGDPAAGDEFLRVAGLARARAVHQDGELLWLYPVAVPKYGIEPPWPSALAQGQGASMLVRAHQLTGDAAYRDDALAAVASLLDEASGLLVQTDDGPILEEMPSDPPAHILNGWISGLFGLHDVAIGTGDERAREGWTAGLACLRTRLPSYDLGWWTRYSLYPHALTDLAKPIYQEFHVAQLRGLHEVTGDREFAEIADRWAGYDTPPRRARVLLQKGAFLATRSRR